MWKDDFYAAVRDFINKRYGVNAVEVTSVQDQVYRSYGCDTCGPDMDYTCDIWYKAADDKVDRIFTYQGRFSSLIEDIT